MGTSLLRLARAPGTPSDSAADNRERSRTNRVRPGSTIPRRSALINPQLTGTYDSREATRGRMKRAGAFVGRGRREKAAWKKGSVLVRENRARDLPSERDRGGCRRGAAWRGAHATRGFEGLRRRPGILSCC